MGVHGIGGLVRRLLAENTLRRRMALRGTRRRVPRRLKVGTSLFLSGFGRATVGGMPGRAHRRPAEGISTFSRQMGVRGVERGALGCVQGLLSAVISPFSIGA
ncbi:unnamed protein product, partial [Hapterophycus canaliculatus]